MKERSIAEQTLFRFSYAVGLMGGKRKRYETAKTL